MKHMILVETSGYLGGFLDTTSLQPWTGQDLYYTFKNDKNNADPADDDIFIMVGVYHNSHSGNIFADGELQWLYERLEEYRNNRCFLFMHFHPLNGSGDAVRIDNDFRLDNINTGIAYDQGKVFYSLISHYSNVIWFHGHSHDKFELQEENKMNTYDNFYGRHSIHIPSLGYPRGRSSSGGTTDFTEEGQGYVVDVYDNNVVLKGRDFLNEKFLPIASYSLDTPLQTVPEKTYTDSRGIINTN